jgi:hypothetical protein
MCLIQPFSKKSTRRLLKTHAKSFRVDTRPLIGFLVVKMMFLELHKIQFIFLHLHFRGYPKLN